MIRKGGVPAMANWLPKLRPDVWLGGLSEVACVPGLITAFHSVLPLERQPRDSEKYSGVVVGTLQAAETTSP